MHDNPRINGWARTCLVHLSKLDGLSILQAVAWIVLGIFSLIRFQADYLLVVGVCLTLSVANIVGFTKCRKGLSEGLSLFYHISLFPCVLHTIERVSPSIKAC